ncbi:MAG: AsmA-like C-terminal region-containing protein, partial [Bilophila sp.]
LELGLLDVDSYLPKSEKTTPDNATRWPVEQLHTFEVQGKLHAQELRIAKIPHTNVVLPFTLKSGVFTAEPVAARVCGGEVSAIFRTEATPRGALTRLQYTLTQARKQDTLLSGSGTLTTDIHALLRSSADIPSALNGTWAFRINDGSLDPQKPLPANARSRFFSLGASGTLTSGVLNSRDLALAGAGLAVHGQGSINLVNWTLDYDILASGTGMPDIPIRYHGSLDDPKRSIDALRVIGNTLGTIGSGILGIIDDVLSAPLKIIGPPRGQHH